MLRTSPRLCAAAAIAFVLAAQPALGQKTYDTGASDTEIKIGNIMPYSGPAAAYGVIGKTEAAYFRMINDAGGINGRQINFISYDDGYSPPRAIEQVRKLVENDGVLAVFNPLGTPSNVAMQRYLNAKKIPQLFVASGATKWDNPREFPWTIGWQPNYQSEAQIYAKWLLKEQPNAKIGVIYQNDDFGRDYLKGLKDGLGANGAAMVVIEESYETSEPTVENQIVRIKAASPDVLIIFATPKFSLQAVVKAAEMNWKPLRVIGNVGASVETLKPAGFENVQGVLTAGYAKSSNDPQWANDPGMKKWNAFMDKYMPGENKSDFNHVYGYGVAQTLAKVLAMCGDDLTRENVMRQAASLKDFELDTLLPGVKLNTSATNFGPIAQLQMARFKDKSWEMFGEIISADATNY